MKRDLNIFREVLLQMEAVPAGETIQRFDVIPGVDAVTLNEHLALMIEAGLLDGEVYSDGREKTVTIHDIGVGSGSIRTYSHRASYEIHKGKIPENLLICHSCDNPACINPEHFFLGNKKVNAEDMVKKGRSLRGERRPNSILREKQVLEIRNAYKPWVTGLRELAEKYGVSEGCIQGIVEKVNWKHLA